jgi:hypothetical protein
VRGLRFAAASVLLAFVSGHWVLLAWAADGDWAHSHRVAPWLRVTGTFGSLLVLAVALAFGLGAIGLGPFGSLRAERPLARLWLLAVPWTVWHVLSERWASVSSARTAADSLALLTADLSSTSWLGWPWVALSAALAGGWIALTLGLELGLAWGRRPRAEGPGERVNWNVATFATGWLLLLSALVIARYAKGL